MKRSLLMKLLAGVMAAMLIGCAAPSNTEKGNNTQIESQNVEIEENGTELTSEAISEVAEYEFVADLTHDGQKERVSVLVDSSDKESVPTVMIMVLQDDVKLYEQELICNMALGSACYLVQVDGKDYLMNYNPLVDHDMATCEYSVFSISESGETVVLDEQSIELSLFEVETMNKEEWIAFAEKENTYFENGYLLASTIDGDLINGTTEPVTTYKEVFAWMVFSEENVDSVEEALELFAKETMESYSE